MDGLSGAASVIAVVDISARVASLCLQYSVEVKHAKGDIERLHRKVNDTKNILEKLQQLLDKQGKSQLPTTNTLLDPLQRCSQELKELEAILQAKLEPSRRRKAMQQFGFRALKWPFTSKEVEKTVQNLEKYGHTFSLALQVDQTVLVADISQQLNLTKLPVATGASFNTHAEEHNARCLPNTRTELLTTIREWANNKDSKTIFWLCGMAGTGKSTIARTVAQDLAEAGQLGASFFFKKGEGERGNASRFFSTIATDLVAREPGMLPGIRKALNEDSAVSQRALKDQFEKLILHPLSGLQQTHSTILAWVIVIDALDECEREEDIRAILQLLTQTKHIQPVSLRVLVTSRPELHIRLGFKQMSNGTYQDLVLHEVAKNTIEHDIRLFYEHELSAIRQARMLSPDWPTTDQIQALVELAVPLFIFAATVCRYIGTKGGHPEGYLRKVLGYQKSTFSQLDRTYLPILEQLLAEQEEDEEETWLHAFQKLVGSIVVLESPLSIASLARLLQVPQSEVECRLDALHSVLSVPNSQDVPVRLLHLSFRDFLVDRQRQGKSQFWIDARDTHSSLASSCLELMSRPDGLRQNICNLPGPGTMRSEIGDGIITSSLSPELQYACRYWVSHIEQSQEKIGDGDATHVFLQKHFLHWLEAMSLMRELSRCVDLLDRLQTLATPSASIIPTYLGDAKRFVLRFQSIAVDAPLQLYYSALTFAPEKSLIRQAFENRAPQDIKMVSRETDWNACRSTLEGHSDRVTQVAFSPDGKLVASASRDRTVRLWNAETGAHRSTLEGHSNWVTEVAFSPDGKLVASASRDRTVRVWDAETGAHRSTLEGHSNWVTEVAFSPDGKLVASVSGDNAVRLWDAETGVHRSTFEGHFSEVSAVAFSPNGKLVASASSDNAVRLWDAETGAHRSTLEGHSDWVTEVAFSPDAKLVASASCDKTVRVWDVETGAYRSTLEGHSGYVTAVAFSPDRKLVASASSDNAVRLWDAETGVHRSTLEGHSEIIWAVVFSPDGKLVASASRDRTVRLWDAETGAYRSTLEGHFSEVSAVAFSPDGKLVASASHDKTVRVWDVETGAYRSTLEGHSGYVTAVAFSPDRKLVASASDDNAVRLWDAETGVHRSTLEGHSEIIWAVVFSPDGKLVASASHGTIRLWDAETGAHCSTLEGHSDWVRAVAFSPDGKLVASASHDKTVRLWDAETGVHRSTLKGHSSYVRAVAFSPDGKLVASASLDKTVRLWDAETGVHRSTLEGHSSYVRAVAFSPDGKLVASASLDKTVRLWDAGTGAHRSTLEDHSGEVSAVAFSPDGKYIQTNRGDIALPSPTIPSPSVLLPQPSYILIEDQWISVDQQRLLWLPPEYRPTCSVVNRGMLYLGYSSSRTTLLILHIP